MTTTTQPTPGRHMAAEIAEQPAVWRRLLDDGRDQIAQVAAHVARRRPRFVLFLARGTSDHAALYAKYLVETLLQLPAGLVSPSTMTTYGSRPELDDVLMVAVSQSGGSPDLVRTLQVARGQNALTLAVTNNPDSALAEAAELHVDVDAGREQAVAATKSYTAQLLALYLLVDHVRGGTGAHAAPLPELGDRVVGDDASAAELAGRYRFTQRVVTTGRGYSSATAHEAALKLMETSYLAAQAFSGADLLHGPLAMIDTQVPVLAVATAGRGGEAMQPVLDRLHGTGTDVCRIETAGHTGHPAGIVLPAGAREELSPLLEIIPCQQLALHLALARGGDPDAPRGLRKVTETL